VWFFETYARHAEGCDVDLDPQEEHALVLVDEVKRLRREIEGIARCIEESPYYGKITASGPTAMLTQVATSCRMVLDDQNDGAQIPPTK
jgi:hypothetical protein